MSHDLLEQLIREQAPSPRAEFTALLDERVERGFGDVPESDPIWPWIPALVRQVRSLRHRPLRVVAIAATLALAGGAVIASAPPSGNDRAPSDASSVAEDPPALKADDYQPVPVDGEELVDGEYLSDSAGHSGSTHGGSSATAVSGTIVDYRRHILGSGLFLKAEPDEVPQVVAGAVKVARDLDGYPGSSSYDVEGGEASGSADVWVPTDRYADAMAQLSRLGTVERTTQQSRDVTASRAALVDQIAADRRLLREMDRRDTAPGGNPQREAIATQLELRRQRLANLDRRIDMTLLNVKVRGVETPARPAERWSIEWAVDTAGTLLRSVAALLIVAAGALLVPVALLGLGWIALTARRRRLRRRALDDE